MSETRKLPVLPLRELVLLPGVTAPLGAGRPGTLAAVEQALESEADLKPILIVTQVDGAGEAVPENLRRVGVLANILHVQTMPGSQQLVVDTVERVSIHHYELVEPEGEGAPYLTATFQELPDLPPLEEDDPAFEGLVAEVREQALKFGRRNDVPDEALRRFIQQIAEPGLLANRVGYQLDISVEDKQTLLETLEVEDRLRKVLVHLNRQNEIEQARARIRDKVQSEFGDRQREMVLREQMRAIQSELGEESGEKELEALREKLAGIDLPEKVREEVDRSLGRAERLNRESAEAQVVWTWLEWVSELPWDTRSEDQLDIAKARRILEEDHAGLEDVKRRVLEYLAVKQLRRAHAKDDEEKAKAVSRGPILLFLGPPGTGKTSVAKSIARALGRSYERIALGGARDEADIRGHRRTYVGALPGRIIQGLKRAKTKNPVFCLDEVDKLGRSFQGDPGAALLEVLDPAQNDSFEDRYLDVPFDLSETLFLCTANFLEGIPGPLRDRMEIIEFSGYTEREKKEIARRFLLPRQREEAGLTEEQLEVTDEALERIISGWTREAGLRQLEREIGSLCRKAALRLTEEDLETVVVDADTVRDLLGRPRVRPEKRQEEDQVGVATGMYYTSMGGDIMFVEASAAEGGKGKLTLTGQLGDVMKESAHAALTYARDRARELGIDPDVLRETDLHIHVPAGAVPKDGPSAGVTMATALVSVLSGRPARADLAMTGEVTLRGRVLPIGGVKEKVLGAVRAGIQEILLPRENLEDLEDLPEDVRGSLTVHGVDSLDEVLALALEGEVESPAHVVAAGSEEEPPSVTH